MKRAIKRQLRRLGLLPDLQPASQSTPAAAAVNHVAEGDAARALGNWGLASEAYERHLAVRPGDFDIWVQLGHALKENADFEGAAEAYAKAEALRPSDHELLVHRGHLERRRGNLVAAGAYYQLSYAREPAPETLKFFLASDIQHALILHGMRPSGRPVGEVEGLEGVIVHGWARDPLRPGTPPDLQVLIDGKIVREGPTGPARVDLSDPDNGPGFSFEFDLGDSIDLAAAPCLTVRLSATGEPLRNTPLVARRSEAAQRWLDRHGDAASAASRAMRSAAAALQGGPLSIVMLGLGPDLAMVRQTARDAQAQWSHAWELICVDDGSASDETRAGIAALAREDPRIRLSDARSGGLSGILAAGARAATGAYVLLLTNPCRLEPEAVFQLLAATATGADIIYADDVITTTGGEIRRFVARPAFSYDYLLSTGYIDGPVCLKRSLLKRLKTLGPDAAIHLDLVLQALERAQSVAHIPSFLYRRCDTGAGLSNTAIQAATDVVNDHLVRIGADAVAGPGPVAGVRRIRWRDPGGRTLVIVPTKDRVELLRPCIESILATTRRDDVTLLIVDHDSTCPDTLAYLDTLKDAARVQRHSGEFNYSAINNQAARDHMAGHQWVLFMNNDVEAIEPGWLEEMRSLCGRSDVGVVGATLLYDDRRVQHAGVVIGLGGVADHTHKRARFADSGGRLPGYCNTLVSTRECSAVTAACMMMPCILFEKVGGFDERLVVGFNDTDLCLRVGRLGYKVINSSGAVLLHHESATRRIKRHLEHPLDNHSFKQRWAVAIAQGDPYYNPQLSLGKDYQLETDFHLTHAVRVAPVRPVLSAPDEAQPTVLAPPVFVGLPPRGQGATGRGRP